MVPVPEPGPALLLGMAALVGLMSRRRRGAASAID
ncbi:MAG TPA: hypothetical protein DCP71_08310 [Verrucomicrobiales bacterium]|nr:hypothetical protein [Verrucomicrobiales bacterium]